MRLGLPCSSPSRCWRPRGSRSPQARPSRRSPPPRLRRLWSCLRSSSPTSVSRRMSSPRGCSSRAASPGASRVRSTVTRPISSPPRRPRRARSWLRTGHQRSCFGSSGTPGYAEQGAPEDKSPYAGVPARKFGVAAPKAKAKAEAEGRRSCCADGEEDHCGREEVEGCRQDPFGYTQARVRRARRAFRAAGRDDARRAREEAQCLGLGTSEAHACGRRPLALPAQLDRLRSEVRLVARHGGPERLSSPSTSASRPSGASAATARPWPGKPSSTSRPRRGDARRALAHAPGGRERLHAARAADLDGDPPDHHDRLHRPSRLDLQGGAQHEQPLPGPDRGPARVDQAAPRGALREPRRGRCQAHPGPSARRSLSTRPVRLRAPARRSPGARFRTGRAATVSGAMSAPPAAAPV